MSDDKPSDRPFYKWLATRELWYDVTKAVVSALSVIIMALLFAAVTGIEFDPYTGGLLAYLALLLLLFLLLIACVPFLGVWIRRTRSHPWLPYVFALMLVVVVVALVGVVYELFVFNREFG